VDIQNCSAIVTGGASGLGEATARLLATRGAAVIIADINDERGKAIAAEINGGFAHADVTDQAEVAAAIAAAVTLAPLRVLVNSAGIGAPARTVDRHGEPADMASFERVVRVNLFGSFNFLRLAAAQMARIAELASGERGAIVNTASIAAFEGRHRGHDAAGGPRPGPDRGAGQHHRPRPVRHADLRPG
jgi:NAD(P)-dependent dehydrogenase (short-subunit alcohol dehydrogenase family)